MPAPSTGRPMAIGPNRRIFTALMAGAATLLVGAHGATAQEKPIKFGGVMSITGGGASIGRSAQVAWRLAIEDINAAGGLLGRKVELVIADTQTDPTHAVAETRRLIDNEKVDVLVGPATSQEAIPTANVSTEKKVIQISTAASTALTPKVAPYHFSTSATGANQLIPGVEHAINKLKATKLAFVSDNGGMSKAAIADILAYLEKKNMKPVIVQEFAFRAEDLTPQLFSMRRANADAILMMSSLGDDARKLLENRGDIGWNAPVLANQTMTNFAVGNAKLIGADAFKDVYSVQFAGLTYCPGDPVGASEFAKFSKRASAAVPDLERLGGPHALISYYIQPMIIAAAIKGSGKLDGPSLTEWLEKNAGSIPSMVGKLQASSTDHFMPSVETMRIVTAPHKMREDGLVERADCK